MNEENKTSGWGGARANSGRKKKTREEGATISAHISKPIRTMLKRAALKNGITLSKQTAKVLTDWAAAQDPNIKQPDPSPDALTAAVNRLADALEKIVERVSIDKE